VERNARELGLARLVEVRTASVSRVLEAGTDDRYHVALLDPPYPLPEASLAQVLDLLVTRGWLEPEAVVVVERSARSPEPSWPDGLVHLGSRSYGETAVHVAEVTTPAPPPTSP
jgi:16S rRNA (guanine966-N2)-methyltransferase